MARMVFGQWTTGDSPAQAEHFAARRINGTKTACGLTIGARRSYRLQTWKVEKMVTCERCRKALGVAGIELMSTPTVCDNCEQAACVCSNSDCDNCGDSVADVYEVTLVSPTTGEYRGYVCSDCRDDCENEAAEREIQ